MLFSATAASAERSFDKVSFIFAFVLTNCSSKYNSVFLTLSEISNIFLTALESYCTEFKSVKTLFTILL